MALPQIIESARKAQLQLKSDGHNVEAEAVHRLILSRKSSQTLNRVLHTDLARVRALVRRAHDAMSRRDPDGISSADWDQLLDDMGKELEVKNEGFSTSI
jgi:hypothetical protein